jgi:hypothetical protein
VIALAAVSALVAGNGTAAIETTLHTGYSSEYLWRGQDLGNDLIETGIDATTQWQGLGLSAGAWYATFDNPAAVHTDELDLYGEVSKDFGFIKPCIGYIAYLYPDADTKTYQEVYFGASHDFGFVDASLKYFWDVSGDNDGYTEFGLAHSFKLSPCLNLSVASNVGYLVEQGQATAWTNKVTLDWSFAEHVKLSPYVALSMALSDDPDTLYANSANELVAGAMLSVTF